MKSGHPPALPDRAELVRKLMQDKQAFTFTVSDEAYQQLLEDCAGHYAEQWHAPSLGEITLLLDSHGYRDVVNPLHVLGRWAMYHLLYPVVRQLPALDEPRATDIKVARRAVLEDIHHQMQNADTDELAEALHDNAAMLRETGDTEIRDMRMLCMMVGLPPFHLLFPLTAPAGKPLH